MKKLFCILFASLFLFSVAYADNYDFSKMKDEELIELINAAKRELSSRSTQISGKTYLVNDKYAAIYFTGKAWDTYGEYKLEVIFENKSDMELMFSVYDVILNGWQLTGYDDIPITAAGAKAKGALYINYKQAELESYQDIDFVELRGPHLVGPNFETLARYDDIILDIAGSTWE